MRRSIPPLPVAGLRCPAILPLVLISLALTPAAVGAQPTPLPTPDDCANAFDVSAGGDYIGSTANANPDGTTSCGDSDGNPDVWLRYVAPCTGTLRVDTCGSGDLAGTDTVLSIHAACPGSSANTLACNDQVASSADPGRCVGAISVNDSYVETALDAGETVLIRVSTWLASPPGDFLLTVGFEFAPPPVGSLRNERFDTPLHWCFVDESTSGAADLTGGTAVVTGGNAGESDATTWIEQTFTTYDTATHLVTFDWSYASIDSPGFDRAAWDLVDVGTGLSVVGGPLALGSTDGDSGSEMKAFTGTGTYIIRLGTWTEDGIAGPGVSTFDDVDVLCEDPGGPFVNGDFSDPSGAGWCFTDRSDSGSTDLAGGAGVVVGGDDGDVSSSETYIIQVFDVPPGPHEISFVWAYASTDDPGYDAAYWNIYDFATGLSAIGGSVVLGDTDGDSGFEIRTFDGSGSYLLQLGTVSDDNLAGPGISTFDDIAIVPATCDPVAGLVCSVDVADATLSWTNGSAYDSVRVERGGATIATLPGTATEFTDFLLPLGSFDYDVIGVCTLLEAPPASCTATVACAPITALLCTVDEFDAQLSWTNGDTYTDVRVLRDGAQVAVLPAGTTAFTDPDVEVGTHDYEVRGVCGQNSEPGPMCTVEIICDGVTDLVCAANGSDAELAWTNGTTYASVRIFRDAVQVAVLSGSATSFTDPGLPVGSYDYEVIGLCGQFGGDAAACTIAVAPGPPEFRRGDCSTDGAYGLGDPVSLLGHLFPNGGTPTALACLDACDANDDELLDVADVIDMLTALYVAGTGPLPAPYPGCGPDPTSGALECATTVCP